MSWDQQAYSFGNPNAQPPTPTKTPTSAQFPSPTFQTPRNNNSSFEDRSGWTPTFAEEYSVFNSTPGRLTSNNPSFVDAPTPRPATASAQNRGLSNTGDIAAELATHVHHFSPNPSLPLPPVDPSNQLPSSPGPYSSRFDDSRKEVTPRKPKKRLEEAFSGQTATPPATASKGSRKLAPKLSADTMQNDLQGDHYSASQTPTHNPNMMDFPSTSADFFSYPMSAPATAPVFTNTKPFWDPDSSMGGMDLDFNPDDTGMFNTSSHKISNSFDWGRSNQMFQDTVNVPPPSQSQSEQQQKVTSKRPRPLAPKVSVPGIELPATLPPFDFSNTPVSDDPFSVATLGGAVDPGLLFSRNISTSMAPPSDDTAVPLSRPATSHLELQPYSHQMRESMRDREELREELRRSRSMRDSSRGRRFERGTVSSPIRGSARPGLQRSVSDSRGKMSQDRIMPRSGGRISPVKRPSGLTSIPELPAPKTRTEVKFIIDNNGRARAETVVIRDEPEIRRRGPSGVYDDEELSPYESSTDEEPIIIQSRNTSFNLPQSKAPKLGRFETSNRRVDTRRQSMSGSGYSQSESSISGQRSTRRDSFDSEAETVMEDDGSGDATRELRKLVESRKSHLKAQNASSHRRRVSNTTPRGRSQYVNYGSSNISPTTVTDPDGATPSSTRSGTTRCVCNNSDSEGFMIQCESCDNWLHAECVGIDRRSLPPVYVCAFCAQTPNMRGGRIREPARGNTHVGSSPLAHKSFQSFR